MAVNAVVRPNVGLYFYGWYDHNKWTSHRFPYRPQIGFYHSGDPRAARWQVEQIARTGVDFVAFEMVPHSDQSFGPACDHIRNCVPLLAERGIGYAMFMDSAIFELQPDALRLYAETLARLDAEGWLAGTGEWPNLGRPLIHFAPNPATVADLRKLTPSGMRWLASTWQRDWGKVRPEMYSDAARELLKSHWVDALARDVTVRESLEPMGYFTFWTQNDDLQVMNGIAGVAVGYDDRMLKREPVLAVTLDRADGRTLETQFRNAQVHDAHTVMIYGWNEYFESAVIEPTIEFGDFYVRLTAHFVAQLKAGEPIAMPSWAGAPSPAAPLYLDDDLEHAGARYADGLPRWDENDWRADLAGPPTPSRNGRRLRFNGITVKNAGRRAWPIASGKEPISLGVRLFAPGGAVVREERAALGPGDVEPGRVVRRSIDLDLSGIPSGRYRAEIGVVWDGRMWFHPAGGRPLVRYVSVS